MKAIINSKSHGQIKFENVYRFSTVGENETKTFLIELATGQNHTFLLSDCLIIQLIP